MRTLVLLEDQWHPAEVLQTGLSPFARFGFGFHWLANTNEISAQLSGEYRIVILAKANDLPIGGGASWVSEQVQQAFVDHVHRGGGLLVLHSGVAGYEDVVKLRRLMGGAFRQHPEQCLVCVIMQTTARCVKIAGVVSASLCEVMLFAQRAPR